ncbi:hypothetical protein K6119_09890 [Paracrocinitomix mangrovi]|uniref:DUF6896 domain-containing protein n=1 Tax=Paracrocinitomix mangrovi TaxID=2862509 RepID=UPI001C8E9ED5|nr:hypothetical protein [Paracrocinitomix mangrovi]UKN03801.1 hypothetical protein K6119_09890 [Paracrocinitomix mangrovi]
MKVKFGRWIKSKRESIGKKWKSDHPNFQIGIHTVLPEINIVKLITSEEIHNNQDFFEKCAKDYRNLATKLITAFAKEYDITINPELPMDTLRHTNKFGYEPVGEFNGWKYAFHGIHCAFTNKETGQQIEVPLNYGLEFGQLDPYFFVQFIKTTQEYEPIPVKLFCDYADGKRILEEMVELGKFEYINSNWPDEKGVVVKERSKVDVPIRKTNAT